MKLILISCEFLLELMKNFRPNATISVKLENSVKSNLGMYCVNIKCTYYMYQHEVNTIWI